MKKYIMTLDEGTTSLRTLIIDKTGKVVSTSQKEFTQYFPQSGWVEHDANEILSMQVVTIKDAKNKKNIKSPQIEAVGITNQRETIVLWDKATGLPVYNAIVWQDTRTSKYCDQLIKDGHSEMVTKKTGLIINPYFSGTKIKWILENVDKAKEVLAEGNLLAGTMDTWLIWNLTKDKVHATDVSNASRTMLYNIETGDWDDEILELLGIPRSILPEVKSSSDDYGIIKPTIFSNSAKGQVPITGVIGDQQSALFGQLAVNKGDVKNTYGTGNFTLVNIGEKIVYSKNKLLTTVAWKIGKEKTVYAIEGSVFIAGAAIQWLRDGIRIIYDASQSDAFAKFVPEDETQNVIFVPALSGLGAPYWDTSARGAIFGLERGTKREHIIKATLEAIAYQSNDLIKTMGKDIGKKIDTIKVDGGASNSNYLMQFQASISDAKVVRPKNIETTAMGAAYMAGLHTGYWSSIDELKKIAEVDRVFTADMDKKIVDEKTAQWDDAVQRTRGWAK